MKLCSQRLLVLLLLLVLHGAGAHAEDCQTMERRLDGEVASLPAVADDRALLHRIGTESLAAVKVCPASDRLWYLAARSAELLEVPSGGKAFHDYGGLKAIVADAQAHRPTSFAIATIAARLDGSSSAARYALALKPDYPPARRALALALLKEGDLSAALSKATTRAPQAADYLVRAKILLAGNHPAQAEKAVEAALRSPASDESELTLRVEVQRDANEILGFALLKQGRIGDAKRALQIAAADGSLAAQRQLQSVP